MPIFVEPDGHKSRVSGNTASRIRTNDCYDKLLLKHILLISIRTRQHNNSAMESTFFFLQKHRQYRRNMISRGCTEKDVTALSDVTIVIIKKKK